MGNKRPGDVLIFTKHTVIAPDLTREVRDAAVKGDVAGHDFHGNRYTGGIGGSIHDAQARFKALKAQWAIANNDLLRLMNNPMSPEAVAKLGELRAINVEMAQLQADPGGPQGMGMPGGPRDVLIIGAGPGGLAAAINAKADGLDTLVVDGAGHPGGQSAFSSRIENYPGFPAGVTGEQLASSMYDQATRLGADTQFGVRVTGITQDPVTGMKTVALSDGTTVDARTVILAGGVTQRTLDFPGADAASVIYGDGQKVAQMSVGGEAVIIGGSNGAAQAALGAAESADHVTVFARTDLSGMSDYQIEALRSNRKIDVIQHEEIASYDEATGQVFAKDGYALSDVKAIGVFAGGPPDTSWLPKDINLVKGSVAVDGDLQTSMPGVFAVGDVRDGAPHRVLGAAADGQVAEKNVWNYLDKQRQKKSARARGSATGMVAFIDKMYHLDVASPYGLQITEGPHDAKAFHFEELKTRALAELKGDLAGHRFHGNRFTGGIGENPVNGLLSHAQWRDMLIHTFGANKTDTAAANRDAMVEYKSEIADPMNPLDGKTFTDDKEMTAYVRDLAAKWTPGVKVTANHTSDWMETGGASYPQERDNTFKIQMGRSYMNERVLLHEFSHVLAAERVGEIGHGTSFRQAYLDVLGSVRPADAAALRANYAKAPAPITKDVADDLMIEPMGMVRGPMGVVVCIGHVEEAKSSKGDVAGHAFHGNRWTGGIGGIDGPPNVGHYGDAVHQAIVSHKITNEPEAYGYLNSPAAAALTVDERERLLQQARSYASLREYQGNESGITNGYLRGEVTKDSYPNADKEFWQGLQDRVANIDAAMSPSPTDKTVYRAMGELGAEKLLGTEDNTANMLGKDLEAKLDQLTGSSIVDGGYVSTSLDKEVAGAKTNMVPILFEISEPKGTSEVSFPDHPGLGDDARYAYEKEVLLGHGQKYRIDGWRVAPATEFGTQYPTHIVHLTASGPAATAKTAEKPTVTEHDRFVWDDGFDIIPA